MKILWGYIDALKNNTLKKANSGKKKYPEMTHYPRIFPKMPNQTFNDEIKLVLDKIGINEKIYIIEKRSRKSSKIDTIICTSVSVKYFAR